MNKEDVLKALRGVQDPQTGNNVVEAGLVKDLKLEGKEISFSLVVRENDAKVRNELNFSCQGAVREQFPEADVHVHMISDLRKEQGSRESEALPQVKNIIAVASGKGGVGKSTVAVNLALGLRQLGGRVGIMDADLYGPSVPTMLGLDGQRPKVKEVYGKHKMEPLEAYGLPVMSIGFIVDAEQSVVLRGPRLSGVIKQFISDCLWPELDYLVVDLPPGTGDIQLTLVQTVPVTGAVMVTTPQDVAVSDAIKAMNMFRIPNVDVPILGVVENMSWFTPEELPDNKYYLFGKGGGEKLTKMSESVLLGQIPLVQNVREGSDSGKPIILDKENPAAKAMMEMARNVARQTALRNESMPQTERVEMDR